MRRESEAAGFLDLIDHVVNRGIVTDAGARGAIIDSGAPLRFSWAPNDPPPAAAAPAAYEELPALITDARAKRRR